MTEIEKYAIKLVADGAEGIAEDDMDEDGTFDTEDDWHDAMNLGVDMAQAVAKNADSFLAWFRSVATDG